MKLATRLCSVGLVLSVGCGADEGAAALPCAPSEDAVCWSDHYFRRYGPLQTESCAPDAVLAPLELEVLVRLFRTPRCRGQHRPRSSGAEGHRSRHSLAADTLRLVRGLALQADGACASIEASCVSEGGMASAKTFSSCCPGLTRSENVNLADGQCRVNPPDAQLCTRCGNGACGAGENACNCPSDCAR